MNLFKKLKKILTQKKENPGNALNDVGFPIYTNCDEGEITMTHCKTEDSQTQTEKIICPTCECLPEKETIALKQIRINQKLDETTSDAIVLPYYSLVPPFHIYDDQKNQNENGGTSKEFANRAFIGVMSNKKGKSAVKKLYLSVYGTIKHVDEENDVVVLNPIADYDKEGKIKKPCVSGLELLVASSNLLNDEKEKCIEEGKASILGKRLIDVLLGNTYFEEKEMKKIDGIRCSFKEHNTACYDGNLNRIAIKEMEGKLVVAIVDYCLYDGGLKPGIGLHFVRILEDKEEVKKVTDLVNKYYFG